MAPDGDDVRKVAALSVRLEGFGLPKARRIRARRDYLAAQSAGVRVHCRHFVLILSLSPERGGPARLGVTVTRKVGNAVRRNRVKRLIREAFRLAKQDRPLVPEGMDLIVIAKDGAPTLSLADIRLEWGRAGAALTKAASTLARRHQGAGSGLGAGVRAPSAPEAVSTVSSGAVSGAVGHVGPEASGSASPGGIAHARGTSRKRER